MAMNPLNNTPVIRKRCSASPSGSTAAQGSLEGSRACGGIFTPSLLPVTPPILDERAKNLDQMAFKTHCLRSTLDVVQKTQPKPRLEEKSR